MQADVAGLNKLKINALSADQQGHLYVGGSYSSLSAHIGTTYVPNFGQAHMSLPEAPFSSVYYDPNAFVARLDATTGVWGWAVRAGGANSAQVDNIVTDALGRVYVSGRFDKVLPVNTTGASAAQLDGATGNWRWAEWEVSGTLAVDNLNRLYMGSIFDGNTATFGSITLSSPGAAYRTGVVARLGGGVLATAPAAATASMQVWPNPSGTHQVQVAGAEAGAAVQVLDVLGRLVQVARMPAAGPLRLALPAGVYLVRSGYQTQRVVLE